VRQPVLAPQRSSPAHSPWDWPAKGHVQQNKQNRQELNHTRWWFNIAKMAHEQAICFQMMIFHSYISLPEGRILELATG